MIEKFNFGADTHNKNLSRNCQEFQRCFPSVLFGIYFYKITFTEEKCRFHDGTVSRNTYGKTEIFGEKMSIRIKGNIVKRLWCARYTYDQCCKDISTLIVHGYFYGDRKLPGSALLVSLVLVIVRSFRHACLSVSTDYRCGADNSFR